MVEIMVCRAVSSLTFTYWLGLSRDGSVCEWRWAYGNEDDIAVLYELFDGGAWLAVFLFDGIAFFNRAIPVLK